MYIIFLVIGERPDDYESRSHSVDLEKIISLSELFILESVSIHDKNYSSEPLKQNFLTKLQCLLDKLKWYDVLVLAVYVLDKNRYITYPG